MIRPSELEAIRDGEIDLAFRRWDRPRVKVGTRLRTAVGLLEVTCRTGPARRAPRRRRPPVWRGLADRTQGRPLQRPDGRVFRVGLHTPAPTRASPARSTAVRRRARPRSSPDSTGSTPRRRSAPGPGRRRAHRPQSGGARARARRAGGAADGRVQARRPQAQGTRADRVARDRLPPLASWRGRARPRAVPRERAPRRTGTPLPRTIGAPATRALRAADVTPWSGGRWTRRDLAALHGVGPIALDRMAAALAAMGLGYAPG